MAPQAPGREPNWHVRLGVSGCQWRRKATPVRARTQAQSASGSATDSGDRSGHVNRNDPHWSTYDRQPRPPENEKFTTATMMISLYSGYP
jgi:hypothetical protein